jgi:iron complex transport system substrate-binding protein
MKTSILPIAAVLIFCLTGVFFSCRQGPSPASALGQPPVLDYGRVPLEVQAIYAKNFSLSASGEYKILRAWNFWKGSPDTTTYVLYPQEQTPPTGFEGAVLVPFPLRSIVCLSTTQVAMLSFLDADSTISGVSGLANVYDEKVRGRAEAGLVVEVGDGQQLDYERIALLKPDLVLAFGMGNADDVAPRLAKMGIPVALTAEYLEETPLGRAEWVRFVGALVDRDSIALARYLAVAADYEALQKMNLDRKERPTVMAGAPDRGTWYVPGGNSFVAQMIEDAGGRYVWKESGERGSLALGFEAVFEKAQNADVWLDVVYAGDLAEVAALDRRAQRFKAFQNGQVYNYDRRLSPRGGYDIFESGVVNPHLVLRDLTKAFFPEEFPDIQPVYYRKLGPPAQEAR